MLTVTKIEKDTYNIFHYLRENLPLVNPCAIRHLSTYIAKSKENVSLDDLVIFNSENNDILYELNISNETKIIFYNTPSKELNFVVEKTNGNIVLSAFVVNLDETLDSAYVHVELNHYDFHFVMGITADNKNGFIETYQTGKKIVTSTHYFKLEEDPEVSLDIFDGLGYITQMLLRAELLYDNVTKLNEHTLVRKK